MTQPDPPNTDNFVTQPDSTRPVFNYRRWFPTSVRSSPVFHCPSRGHVGSGWVTKFSILGGSSWVRSGVKNI